MGCYGLYVNRAGLSEELVRMPTPLRKIFLWQMQTFAQMGRDPSRASSNFFITETEGSKSPKMRRRRVAPD